MKILDLQTGNIHEYGTNGHDSLYVSQDGRCLTYYNLQNGDGSGVGDYRFVCDDDKIPAESETADARHCEVYFNIGGWNRPQGEWIIVDDTEQFIAKCSVCGRIEDSRMVKDYPFCHCGADMKGGAE